MISAIAVAFMLIVSSSSASGPAFVPGEVIVKFRDASEGSRAVRKAAETSDQRPLSSVLTDLETRVGVPLKLKGILSGGRVLAAIECHALTEQAVERLGKRSHVTGVTIEGTIPKGCSPSDSPAVHVIFAPGTAEYETVIAAANEPSTEFRKLLGELEDLLNAPLNAEIEDKGRLVVKIDVIKITNVVADRLKATSDVESAQPNFVMTFR